ncbi:MAG: hypothetical protein SGJ20_14770, partial [Planctomycetota bacterium]|nr:hypothetical protein [Planctomycetota bacterium]
LEVPHIRLDNCYGKLSAFAEAWTQELTWVHAEPDIDSSLKRFETLRQGVQKSLPRRSSDLCASA